VAKKRRRLVGWLWRGVLLVVVGVLLLQLWFLAHIFWWIDHNPTTTAYMEDRLQVLREKNSQAVLQQRWVPYNRISSSLKRAVIAAEDAKFLDHEGFDWEGIQKALEKNVKRGRIVAGGSTISQQLARNLFLSGERSWWRKAQEAAITLMIEAVMSKRRILEIYLNVVELGDGVYGAEAAARHYFNLSAASLTEEQAAFLASILPRPRYYDRNRATPFLTRKMETIRTRMPSAVLP
jgi:monofunctional biosynthetic peptidoglycan transglycosylase